MKNRVLAIIMVVVVFVVGMGWRNLQQQEEFVQERAKLAASETVNSANTTELAAKEKLLGEKEQALAEARAEIEKLASVDDYLYLKNVNKILDHAVRERDEWIKKAAERDAAHTGLEERIRTAEETIRILQEQNQILEEKNRTISLEKQHLENKALTKEKTPPDEKVLATDAPDEEKKRLTEKIKESDTYIKYLQERLIPRIENAFLEGATPNDAEITIRSILLLPADYEMPVDIEKDSQAIQKGLQIVQYWFSKKVGNTFNLGKPVVMKGQRSLQEYEKDAAFYDQSFQASTISVELGMNSPKTHNLVFLYGKKSTNWGEFFGNAIVGDFVIKSLNGPTWARYLAIGTIVHELGHVLGGLPDIPGSHTIMANSLPKETGISFFPAIDFSEKEKEALRRYMK